MAKKSGETEASTYATGPDEPGKPVGPEHDASFHVEDFYDADGKRIATDWDTEAQKNDPGIPPTPDQTETPPAYPDGPKASDLKEKK